MKPRRRSAAPLQAALQLAGHRLSWDQGTVLPQALGWECDQQGLWIEPEKIMRKCRREVSWGVRGRNTVLW